MKKMNRITLCLIISASYLLPAVAHADTVLEFLVKKSRTAAVMTQSIAVKDGRIMVKAAAGDTNADLFYNRFEDSVKIVNHRKRTVMTVDEAEINRINQQAKDVQPLLQELGDQIAKVSPEQRQKWQELFGDNISLDTIAKAAEPLTPARLNPVGAGKKVAGFRCRTMRVMQGNTPLTELCLAEPANVKIPADDYTTIRALMALYERLSTKSQGLARQLGIEIPIIAMGEVTGIPILLQDLSRDDNGSMTLRSITTAAVPPDLMRLPAGYTAEPLTLW
jgi:hypothetical protein